MKNLNITNINKELEINSEFDLIMEKDNNTLIKTIKILNLCGTGGYGVVYKCFFDNSIYVIKLSKNEKYSILNKRYNSMKNKLGENLIKIYYSGKLINNKNYKYYCIMQYGGISLKEYITTKEFNICNLINNLCIIVDKIKLHKLLLPDFKLSNLLVDDNNCLRITDIFMECDDYKLCLGCSIVRTYSVLELSKNIYEDTKYNYSYIIPLFGFSIISILCKKSLSLPIFVK